MSKNPLILGIQFRSNERAIVGEQSAIKNALQGVVDVAFASALDTTLPWEHPQTMLAEYQGVILGGSGDFDFDGGRSDDDEAKKTSYQILERLRPLLSYIIDNDLPTLGICYGHQLLGAFAGACVVNDLEQKKTRSHEVQLLAEAREHMLFTSVPNSFFAHYGHKDSLDRIPEGATLLAEGGRECRVSVLRYKKNIVTTQFHPELTMSDMVERLKAAPGYLPEGEAIEALFKDDASSSLILRNFARFVAERKASHL